MGAVNFIMNCMGTGIYRTARKIDRLSKKYPGQPIKITSNGSLSVGGKTINEEYPVLWRLRNALGIESITIGKGVISPQIVDDLETLRTTFEFPSNKEYIKMSEFNPKKLAVLEVQDLGEIRNRLKALNFSQNLEVLDNHTSGTVRLAWGIRSFVKVLFPFTVGCIFAFPYVSTYTLPMIWGLMASSFIYAILSFTGGFHQGRGYLASSIRNILRFNSMR